MPRPSLWIVSSTPSRLGVFCTNSSNSSSSYITVVVHDKVAGAIIIDRSGVTTTTTTAREAGGGVGGWEGTRRRRGKEAVTVNMARRRMVIMRMVGISRRSSATWIRQLYRKTRMRIMIERRTRKGWKEVVLEDGGVEGAMPQRLRRTRTRTVGRDGGVVVVLVEGDWRSGVGAEVLVEEIHHGNLIHARSSSSSSSSRTSNRGHRNNSSNNSKSGHLTVRVTIGIGMADGIYAFLHGSSSNSSSNTLNRDHGKESKAAVQ